VTRVRATAAISIAVLAVAATVIGQGAPAVDWTPRLEALVPESPMRYFELAEEVADAAENDADRSLARRLFALAGALEPERLGRSSCLALADLAESDAERQRLLALASLLRDEQAGLFSPIEGEQSAREPSTDVALALTRAFSYYRRGKGSQALAELRKPGVEELVTAHERLVRGGMTRFVEDCRLYRGNLRPSLSEEDVTRMLRLEVALLSGADRPWSAELLLNRGAPLIEVDPDRLDESLGIDAGRSVYRNGRWVRP
jgi:hypothetical protein